MKCPNKSHPLFIAMIEKYGNEETATRVWVQNNFKMEGELESSILLRTYNEETKKGALKELDTYLLDFISKFGVKSEELDSLKERLGVDALGATDVLNKLIYYIKNRDEETVPEEVGHMITMLMGETNPIIKELLNEIESWGEFQSIKDKYSSIYNNKKKVKIEAIGQLISKALVKTYKANGLDETLLNRLLRYLDDLVDKLKEWIGFDSSSLKLADKIAVNVLLGNTDFIGNLTPKYDKLDYTKAVENNPHAKDIIEKFGKQFNNKLVGSLAIAGQGESIYRDSNDPIHDLDFIVDNKQIMKSMNNLLEEYDAVSIHNGLENDNYTTISYYIPIKGYTVKVTKRDPSGYSREIELYNEEGEQVKQTSQNVIMVDFFVYHNRHSEKSLDGFSSWMDIYKGKMGLSPLGREERMFKRPKDQNDYLLLNPENRTYDSGQQGMYYRLVEETEDMSNSNSVANTLILLDYFNKNYRKTASGQYEFIPTGEIRTEKTASQLKTPKFISDDPEFLKMTSEYGSIFGEIYQQLLKQLYEGKELSNNIMIEGKMFPLEDRLFNELSASARITYQQLQDKQDRINIIKKTNDKFILRFEQILIDENRMTGKDKGLGGSMDVFVLFSDNSAGVLDVKTIFTKSFIGEDGRIKYFNLNDERREKYKSQLNAYVKMLKEKVGVKSVDIVRVIPIIAQYDEEEKSVHITTETKEGMSIANIVVGQEKTGIASLDKSIQSAFKIIKTLEDRLRDLGKLKNNETDIKKKSNYEIEMISVRERLKAHNESTQEMFLTQDFSLAIKAAIKLSKEVKRELAKSIQDIDIAKVNESIDELSAAVMLRQVNKELKIYNKDVVDISHKINALEDILQELKATRDVISVEYYKLQNLMVTYNKDLRITGEFKNVTGDGWAMRNMANTSDQNNPHIQKLFKAISSTSTKKDFELNAYIAQLRKYSNPSITKAIVDKTTGKMYNRLDWSKTRTPFEDKIKNVFKMTEEEKLALAKDILKIYEYKDYNQTELIQNRIKELDSVFRDSETKEFKDEDAKKSHAKMLDNYIRNYTLYSINDKNILNPDGIISLFKYHILTLKDETKFYTKEYNSLNKEQRGALDWFEKMNAEFKQMLDIKEHAQLPRNFIPLMRKDIIDRFRDSTGIFNFIGSQAKFMLDDLTDLVSDTDFGIKDQIPIKFLRTKQNLDNVKDDQSFDLFATFSIFAEFAYHYKYFSDVVPYVQAYKELLIDKAIVGNKALEANDDVMRHFDDLIQYYIYKTKMYKNETLESLSKTVSLNKVVNSLSNFQTKDTLGLSLLSSTASHGAGLFSVFTESKKGNLFTTKQLAKAEKDSISNRTNYLAFCGFMNVYPDADAHRLGLMPHEHRWVSDNNPDRVKSYIGSRNSLIMKPWQWGEENVTNVVTVSMGQNYSIVKDTNGNLKFSHIQFLESDAKSIYDGMSYNKETGEISFTDSKGNKLSQEDNKFVYENFRPAARAGIRNTVGTANDQDLALYKMRLEGRQLMKFKTWMPGVVLERTRKLRVNEYAQVMEIGRYRAILGNYFDMAKIKESKMQIPIAILELSKDLIANFLMLGGVVGQNFYKLDRDIARASFYQWKELMREENPYELEKLEELTQDEEKQLDLFIKAKQGQMVAALIELRMLVGLLGMIFLLGVAGDDDDDLKNNLAIKKLIRLTDKVRTEIGFFFALGDLRKSFEKPVPILSMITLLINFLGNTFDESRDQIIGENEINQTTGKSKDKTENIFFMKQFMPGWKIFESLDWFGEEEK